MSLQLIEVGSGVANEAIPVQLDSFCQSSHLSTCLGGAYKESLEITCIENIPMKNIGLLVEAKLMLSEPITIVLQMAWEGS